MEKLIKIQYEHWALGFAVLAILWIFLGQDTWDLYYELFKPPLIPDGGSVNLFHEVPVILLSFIGTVFGLMCRNKNLIKFVGLTLNIAIWLPLVFAIGLNKL